ncbi:putative TetR family transcriptional regulator [Oscillibacter valericigenes Sjm18-20]|nr:putative TetR family transcriptional regulator [Oscillibacter valericigenes Sjm18-20]
MNRTEIDISNAFWQLLEEKPYSKITVKDIVDRCQVNRNTFYYHFQDIPSLAEYTIKAWADEMIQMHYKPGSPASCIMPLIHGCITRKNAILHIYRSVHREAFMHYLDEINIHIVNICVEYAAKETVFSAEDKDVLLWFYKCALTGIILDWLDRGMTYDLLDFARKICDFFAGSGSKAERECQESADEMDPSPLAADD